MLRIRLFIAGIPALFALTADAQIQPGASPVNPSPAQANPSPASLKPAPLQAAPVIKTPGLTPQSSPSNTNPTPVQNNPMPLTGNPAPTQALILPTTGTPAPTRTGTLRPTPAFRPIPSGSLQMTPAPRSFGSPATTQFFSPRLPISAANSFPFQQYSQPTGMRLGQPFGMQFGQLNPPINPNQPVFADSQVSGINPLAGFLPAALQFAPSNFQATPNGMGFNGNPSGQLTQANFLDTPNGIGFTNDVSTSGAFSIGNGLMNNPSALFAQQQAFLMSHSGNTFSPPQTQSTNFPTPPGAPVDQLTPTPSGGFATSPTQFPSQSSGGIGLKPRQ